ncbi:MAG: MerR family transcriptional regulator [Bifidobacteriaceae bacterium]|jgi:DNA-binding transcriptional MerR regulator|nr:MerR family transcriptional regulator [Bifidobacteriaceae bacterium]
MEFTSKQLADLVGVTVRTLRHYHQIGLLEEPERTYGGYRIYEAEHVLRLIRIKRLAGLGLALDQVREIVDNPESSDAESILRDLDRALADQISELRAQRRAIAAIRQENAPIDVLPEFARHIAALRALGEADEAIEAEKMLVEVVGGLGTERDSEMARQMLEALTSSPAARRAAELDAALADIGPDATEGEVDSLAAEFTQTLTDLYDSCLRDQGIVGWDSAAPIDQILSSLVETGLNGKQREVVRRSAGALAAYAEQQQPSDAPLAAASGESERG